MLLLNCIDFALFRFAGKRATADLFRIMAFGEDFTNTVPGMVLDFWYLLLVFLLLSVLLIYLYKRISIYKSNAKSTDANRPGVFSRILQHLFVLALVIIGFRGGIQYKPIHILTAAKYGTGQFASLVLNTPFTFIKTIGKNSLEEVNYFDETTLEKIYPVRVTPPDSIAFRPLNVVIIIMESIGSEYIGRFNNGKGYTPFLDSLIDQSFVIRHAFANAKRSIEGIPAILAGIPALMSDPFITSSYSENTFSSLASMLKKKGYYSCFFHGGTNGTMGFDNFTRSAGFDRYFGRSEYGNDKDFDGTWGIYDEPFLHKFADELSKFRSPFLASLFTLSSHHPYSIPHDLESAFSVGTLPIHQSVQYTDYSLKSFFKYASTQEWYQNTLFVLSTDHTAISESSFYQSRVGMYSIPLIFFRPDGSLKGIQEKTSQQIDILPSVLDYLHYDIPYFAFGKSVFDNSSKGFAVNFINDTYQYISDDYSLILDTMQNNSLFHYTEDRILKHNLIDIDTLKAEEMEKNIKAIIQVYNSSLINNKMFY